MYARGSSPPPLVVERTLRDLPPSQDYGVISGSRGDNLMLVLFTHVAVLEFVNELLEFFHVGKVGGLLGFHGID